MPFCVHIKFTIKQECNLWTKVYKRQTKRPRPSIGHPQPRGAILIFKENFGMVVNASNTSPILKILSPIES